MAVELLEVRPDLAPRLEARSTYALVTYGHDCNYYIDVAGTNISMWLSSFILITIAGM